MRYLILLFVLIFSIGCEGGQHKEARLADEIRNGIRHEYLNREATEYVNKYYTRFVTPVGNNIYRFYDPIFQKLCYIVSSAGGMSCISLSKESWETGRQQEIKEVEDAKARKYTKN